MKLSEIIKVWDILHVKDVGEVGFCDLQAAIEKVMPVTNDIAVGKTLSTKPLKTYIGDNNGFYVNPA